MQLTGVASTLLACRRKGSLARGKRNTAQAILQSAKDLRRRNVVAASSGLACWISNRQLPTAVEEAAVVEVVDQDFRDVAAGVDFNVFDAVSLADVAEF